MNGFPTHRFFKHNLYGDYKMRTGLIIGTVAVAALAVIGVYMIDVEQTEEASLPDVDVSVEGDRGRNRSSYRLC